MHNTMSIMKIFDQTLINGKIKLVYVIHLITFRKN